MSIAYEINDWEEEDQKETFQNILCYSEKSVFKENEYMLNDLKELLSKFSILIMHFSNSNGNILDEQLKDSLSIHNSAYYHMITQTEWEKKIMKLNDFKFYGIYVIFDSDVIKKRFNDEKFDTNVWHADSNHIHSEIDGEYRVPNIILKQMNNAKNLSNVGNSWTIELFKEKFRGNFKFGLGIQEYLYPLDAIVFSIGFCGALEYWIRIGSEDTDIKKLVKTTIKFNLE